MSSHPDPGPTPRDRIALAERMGRAARELQEQADPQATVDAAVRLAALNVRGCDAAAISLVERRGKVETPAYTADVALGADLLQYELGEGPCLDTAWHEHVVYSPDLAADRRWPTWGPRVAQQHGVHSILCLQLFTSAQTLGALNLYSRVPSAYDEQDREEGLVLAAHIAVAVSAAQSEQHLTRALDLRTLIGRAVGVVMERYGLDATAAFDVLARVSAESGIRVRDIAQELVETGRLHGTDPPQLSVIDQQ